jgi:hypothetical protein
VTTPREAAFVVARNMREVHKLLDEEGSDSNTQTESSQGTSKATFKSLYVEVNVREIRDTLLRWWIVDHIPFRKADSQYFKAFLKACNPSLLGVLIGRDSLRLWAVIALAERKAPDDRYTDSGTPVGLAGQDHWRQNDQ